MLQLINIEKKYTTGDLTQAALNGVSLNLRDSEFVAILGPSGSGKTTLLNIIGGIETPDSGSVSINGEAMRGMNEKQLTEYRRRHLGYVFQSYNLIPNLTVKENIETGAYLSEHPLDIDEILKTLGLWEHLNKIPNQLSGGQQQRTAIGRAVVKNPDILLCDEPTGALDYQTGKAILKLLQDTCKKGMTVVVITHNQAIAPMANRIIKIKNGKVSDMTINENPLPVEKIEW